MFDIGFWELALVGLISLLVLGPERLPKAARIAGYWLGKARSTVASVKAEIKQELEAEEIRQIEQEQQKLEQFYRDMNQPMTETLPERDDERR
ncbi:MAG: Sec-independent protein translocase protein TatB [Methylococcales bacterium]|nr:Sec-independent protein translocase protein TatB [Methylococcales bacterium]